VGSFNLARCRHWTDQSDRIFAELLGLDGAWPEIEAFCARAVKTDFQCESSVTP